MQYRPCDLCGSLVQTPVPPGPGESLLCEGCIRTRQVRADRVISEAGSTRHRKHIHKFRCLYCGRKLRSKPVARAVHLACPACDGQLVLGPGGVVSKQSDAPESADPGAPVVHLHVTGDGDA